MQTWFRGPSANFCMHKSIIAKVRQCAKMWQTWKASWVCTQMLVFSESQGAGSLAVLVFTKRPLRDICIVLLKDLYVLELLLHGHVPAGHHLQGCPTISTCARLVSWRWTIAKIKASNTSNHPVLQSIQPYSHLAVHQSSPSTISQPQDRNRPFHGSLSTVSILCPAILCSAEATAHRSQVW